MRYLNESKIDAPFMLNRSEPVNKSIVSIVSKILIIIKYGIVLIWK